MSLDQRLREKLDRHGPDSPTARACPQREPYLRAAADRVGQRLRPEREQRAENEPPHDRTGEVPPTPGRWRRNPDDQAPPRNPWVREARAPLRRRATGEVRRVRACRVGPVLIPSSIVCLSRWKTG
ncbi:hypothetical protein [Rhodococcus koreensis]